VLDVVAQQLPSLRVAGARADLAQRPIDRVESGDRRELVARAREPEMREGRDLVVTVIRIRATTI
jgi:hypothetical protein